MPHYANLSFFFNNKLQKLHFPPKYFNEKCSRYLAGKCIRVLVLKKIVNSTQTFLLPFDVVLEPLHKLFALIR